MIEPLTHVLALITVLSLPEQVKTSFYKAVGNLLGGLASIPAAKLNQIVQGIHDTTAARSMTTVIMARAVAEKASKDPALIEAAAEVYLPTELRKANNRLSVAHSAARHLEEAATINTNGDGAAVPDDDWMNSFMRFAEDASSERMQDHFGRVLAGQVLRPGAFGLATLRAMSELDQTIANDFNYAWAKSVGNAVDYSPEWQRGDTFSMWERLRDAGFMATTNSSQYLPPFNPIFNGNSLWAPMQADGIFVNVAFQQESTTHWAHINFTRVGREIGSILPRPDFEANMRKAANRLSRNGLTRIELNIPGKIAELIWQATP